MSSNQRPGGLTALAVINFIYGGFTLLLGMIMAAAIPFLGMAIEQASQEMSPQELAQIQALADISAPVYILFVAVAFACGGLLIASGVGYLKLKKFLGRTLGNSFGVIRIVYGVVAVMILPPEVGGGFGIAAIIGIVYPVLTLILLNTTFKEDFVN